MLSNALAQVKEAFPHYSCHVGESLHDFCHSVGYRDGTRDVIEFLERLLDPSSEPDPSYVQPTQDRISADEYGRASPPSA